MLAVGYAPDVITLWDPLSNELLHSLSQPLPSPTDQLCFVSFAGKGGTLLAHSGKAVFCWDLLSTSLCWSYRAAAVLSAAADPSSDALLVAVSLLPESSRPEGENKSGGLRSRGEKGADRLTEERGSGSRSSELRQSITARAKAEGRARELSTALEEWAPLLHRGFLTKEGRSRAVKRLSQLAQEMREEEGGAQLNEGGKEGGRSAKSARAKHAAVGKEVGKLRGAEEEEGEEGEEGMERGSGDGDGDGKGELEAVEMDSWPPQGWALMDTCGIPNAGLSGPSPYEPFDSS
ncbi:MAG: hypothetical protein SGPRY_007356 [Prymnesium sp.]